MMNDVMIDLETWNCTSDSVIVSIGAVFFDLENTGKEYYTRVCPQSCLDEGLTIGADTIKWWMKQSNEARKALSEGNETSLQYMLNQLSLFLGQGRSNVRVWGNGASFDNTILSTAYSKCGIEQPWKFWNDRCFRTVKNIAPEIKPPKPEVKHHALHDAISQARHLHKIAEKYDIKNLLR